ncbi:uncharacterized protein LOC131088695 [Melospiza georgiana]|uniref:uncharacterized protein LOC131088695 n=1 Tax=Melospiza georgiana TaxID=44398 RepID=UPI0025ABDA65|nr:uncharacterized protein LOC131088695 [Melospiza georgiana]
MRLSLAFPNHSSRAIFGREICSTGLPVSSRSREASVARRIAVPIPRHTSPRAHSRPPPREAPPLAAAAADWLARPRGAARPRPVPRRPLRAPRRLRSGRGRCCGGAGQDGGRAGGRRRQQRQRQRERDGGRERSRGARHPRAPDSLLLVGAALGRGSSAAVAHGAQPGAGPGGGGQLGHPVPEREEAARLPRQRLRPERHDASRAPEAWLRESSSFAAEAKGSLAVFSSFVEELLNSYRNDFADRRLRAAFSRGGVFNSQAEAASGAPLALSVSKEKAKEQKDKEAGEEEQSELPSVLRDDGELSTVLEDVGEFPTILEDASKAPEVWIEDRECVAV